MEAHRALIAYDLDDGGYRVQFTAEGSEETAAKVRIPPFEAIEIDLSLLFDGTAAHIKQRFGTSQVRTMTTITIELPETVFSALHADPQDFAREMRIAAAVKWYEQGKISQAKGAEIAGLSRSDFIDALSNAKVSPFQYTAEELEQELRYAD